MARLQALTLKSKMAYADLCGTKMASILGISPSAFSRKMSGQISFNTKEIAIISQTLHLKPEEIVNIFLSL